MPGVDQKNFTDGGLSRVPQNLPDSHADKMAPNSAKRCGVCHAPLTGQQTHYCSRDCKAVVDKIFARYGPTLIRLGLWARSRPGGKRPAKAMTHFTNAAEELVSLMRSHGITVPPPDEPLNYRDRLSDLDQMLRKAKHAHPTPQKRQP